MIPLRAWYDRQAGARKRPRLEAEPRPSNDHALLRAWRQQVARRLIYIRMIHAPSDFGSVAETLDTVGGEVLSVAGWRKHQESVAAFWDRLQAELMLRLEKELPGADWGELRIYQDGMPVAGEDASRIVDEVADAGSPNYRLLRELLARGARIERTEDAGLLREEYELVRKLAAARGPVETAQAAQAYRQRGDALLRARDIFIARRIDETLKEGELGLLFIGALHRVAEYLPPDIEVLSLS